MLRSVALFSFLLAVVAAKTCKETGSGFNTHWLYANNSILLQFQNTNIKNNHWTGISFGEQEIDKQEQTMQGIFFLVANNQVTVRTGTTTKHGPPSFSQSGNGTSNAAVTTQSLIYFPHEKTLSAIVTLPISFNGNNLQSCQKWNWIKSGKIENGSLSRNSKTPKHKDVCPMECN